MRTRWLNLVGLFLVAGCGGESELSFFALGTDVSVSLYDVDNDSAAQAEALLIDRYASLGRDWYPWASGELAAINLAIAEGDPFENVSPRLAEVIRVAAELEVASRGRFNAGMGNLQTLWGLHDFAETPTTIPERDDVRKTRRGASLVSVDWDGNTLLRANRNTHIDLGGIAKGAILEDSARWLSELGIENAIVNIGGDLIVIGDRTARIGIWSPQHQGVVAGVNAVGGETVVTSGNYERFFELDGQRYNHVLDPRTGYPVQHTVSVTVIDNDPMVADAAATALMVAGPEHFAETARLLGIEHALLIPASGDLRLTSAMSERLDWESGCSPDVVQSSAELRASSACFVD